MRRSGLALTERTMFLVSILLPILLLFLLACASAWLLLFPASRLLLAQAWRQFGRHTGQRLQGWNRGGMRRAGALRLALRDRLQRGIRLMRRHILLMLSGAVVLAVPTMLALLLSGRAMLGGFESDSREINLQVAELLKGEQLAVPAPLPPPAFTTAEVALARPMLDSANRNWILLDQQFSQRLLLVFKIMKETHGYDMAILEGYRSPERQNLLASAGASVTNARAFQSYHQFGLAADCAFLRDGKLVISEKDPWAMRGYQLYGATAEAAGLHWGGRWAMMDFGHTELRAPGTVKK
jgi:peptidoglycan L-alanyl-D-glutamate endopeptidase CwlK